MFDFSDKVAGIDIGGYLVLYLYVIVVVVGETIYKFSSESFKKLFTRL